MVVACLVPVWRAEQILIISSQETDQPAYVAILAAQTTHRAVLAGEIERTPVLCDRATEIIDEAVR